MWTFVFFALFIGTLVALGIVLAAFTKKLAELEKERADLEVEETRVFDFLHGLGEAFSEGVRTADLHRLIVEGAIRILEAHGGALYLVDKNETALVPAFVSNGCPPVVELPKHLLEQLPTNPHSLQSFISIHSVKRGEGIIGKVWESGQVHVLQGPEIAFQDGRDPSLQVHSAIIGPLQYRRKILGILVLANGPMSTPFRKDEISLFKTIAEQSAFALYNEAIYLQASEKKRLDQDLQTAREIQSVLLPSYSPNFEGYEIAGVNIPAHQLSGDYFDYIEIDANRLGIVIADVSGKGIGASLIMAMCRSVLRSQATGATSPSEVLRRVNNLLYPDMKEDMFISMVFAILEKDKPFISLSRAGHEPPLLCHRNTLEVEKILPRGMALGIDKGPVFDRIIEDTVIELAPGDTFILYTDGACEALDANSMEFGIARLIQNIQANANNGPREIVKSATQEITNFIGNQRQYDDITIIAIQKL
ncbi:MAG: SpoIIE family protein phosphatase [Chthoniobacterales bacterium]|nr:SpoIIE family protein phosphatase [Chthoniobacterales bacterium]